MNFTTCHFSSLDAYWERMQQGAGRKSFTYEEMDKTWRIKSHTGCIQCHSLEPLSRDLGEREDDFS